MADRCPQRAHAALAWLRIGLHDPQMHASRKMLALDPRLTALRDDARFRQLSS